MVSYRWNAFSEGCTTRLPSNSDRIDTESALQQLVGLPTKLTKKLIAKDDVKVIERRGTKRIIDDSFPISASDCFRLVHGVSTPVSLHVAFAAL